MSKKNMVVIVPTRDKLELLTRCLDSILQQKSDFNIEVFIVNNRSIETATHSYLAERASVKVRTITYNQNFNFSKICNLALRETNWDVACLVNNDVELGGTDVLQKLGETALMPSIGVAGAVLRFPETNEIQHAGISLRSFRIGKNIQSLSPEDELTPIVRASAVTFALAAFSRSSHTSIGALDEKLAVGWNDVDYGVRAGKKNLINVVRNDVVAFHLESATRGKQWNFIKICRALRESLIYLVKHGFIRD